MNQDSILSEYRQDRTAPGVKWTSSIEDRAKEAERIKIVLAPKPQRAVRQPQKKSLFAHFFG